MPKKGLETFNAKAVLMLYNEKIKGEMMAFFSSAGETCGRLAGN
jgi:hypothetical protein